MRPPSLNSLRQDGVTSSHFRLNPASPRNDVISRALTPNHYGDMLSDKMGHADAFAAKFCFGPYEADARARELCNRGVRVHLRGKSFEILVALLEKPGEVITRAELQRRLWPKGTFVEFEGSLNSAVNRLRTALREEAGRPKYVETLPRVGYRFIAPVERVAIVLPRLAVLPFDNVSRDPDSDFFGDAVTDALITELGNVSGLRVISRQSVLHLKGTLRTAPEIARELKVDAIVEGSVVHAAGRIRATAQLIQAEPEQHLWAKAYECGVADLVTTQGQIARAIADAIQVALTSREVARLSRARPVDPEAHVAYLRGRHLIGRWSGENLKRALEYLKCAVQKDPGHAPAWAQLADCYGGLGFWGHMPFKEAFPRAKDAALKALALDGSLSAAHWAFAWCTWWLDWDVATAETEMRHAIRLNPSDEAAHEHLSFFLITTRGDRAGALAEIRLALELAPLSPHINAMAAFIYLFVRDYERAAEQARRNLELFPESLPLCHALGLAEMCRGRHADAIAALEKAVALSPDAISIAYLGCALARAGNTQETLQLLQDLLARSEREHVAPRCFAYLYAALGARDAAFAWLERAFNAGDAGLFGLGVLPLYDPLRGDGRLEHMLLRLGIREHTHSSQRL